MNISPEQPPRLVSVEADLLDAMMVPARQGDYPRNSRAFVRIDTSLRLYWHTLFDACPGLLELDSPDGLSIFRPFMTWAHEQRLSMNWACHLWLYRWLRESPFSSRLTPELMLSLVGAAAARWATADRGVDGGIAIGCADQPELVVGWKCHSVSGGREVACFSLEEPLPSPEDDFGWFTLPGFELDRFPGWSQIPQ